MNKERIKSLFNGTVCIILLIAFTFVSCNLGFVPSFKEAITETNMKTRVSRVIDAQLEHVKEYLDDELKEYLENGISRSGTPLNGEDIVQLTLDEKGGRDYLDFVYAVDYSTSTNNVDAVMDTAKYILSDDDYQNLVQRAQEVERSIMTEAQSLSRDIPLNQQAAFFKDLKLLVTRSIVLLCAGIVYACIPNMIFWGKVSAACAISVGAGLVSISIMSLYEYYRYGTDENKDFETWFKEIISIPKADFALTASITAIGDALGMGPVVTGIIMCVFALYKTVEMVRTMLKKYNFDA